MFVFALITAELALLYTAYWYLYLRNPKGGKHIRGSLWGTYDDALHNDLDFDVPHTHRCRCGSEAQHHALDTATYAQDFVFDNATNHLVPVRESGSVLVHMANTIDRTLSQLNVRP